jgi:hypothetical protein
MKAGASALFGGAMKVVEQPFPVLRGDPGPLSSTVRVTRPDRRPAAIRTVPLCPACLQSRK